MTQSNTNAGQTRSRAGLIGLLAIFFGPLIIAIWMFYNLDAWQHPERSNYGELMLPIQPVTAFSGVDVEGNTQSLDLLNSIWSLVYVGKGSCDIYCETSLFSMRQVRSMLGNDISRFQYIFLASDEAAFQSALTFKERHPRMIVVRFNPAESEALMKVLGNDPFTRMFLLDPHANGVLRYDQGSGTKGIYHDVHKLLENSRIG